MLFQALAPWVLILQSALGGSPDYVLPDATAAGSIGHVIVVKSDVGRAGITVRAPMRQLIDGAETYSIAAGQAATFQPRNSEWKVVAAFAPAGAAGAHNLLSATHTDTTASGPTDDAVPLGNSLVWAASVLPNCTDTIGQHINYTAATNTFSCGATSSTAATNSVEKSIALTALQPNPAVAVTAAAWVTATSIIVCQPLGTTADGLTPETINAAKLGITVENRVAGVSFDIRIENWYGLEGTVRVHCLGV